MDSAREVLAAVQSRLKAVDFIASRTSNRIHCALPKNVDYPFILITIQNSEPFASDDINGQIHTLRIQSFAREHKPGMALALREAVFTALNRAEEYLPLATSDVVLIEQTLLGGFLEDDGRTYQSLVEFHVTVQ